jgi:hypothetical protein
MPHNDANRSPSGDTQARYTGQERRVSPRIRTPFPATVRSIDVDDQPFEEHTVLDNFSSCGLYLRLARRVRHGIGLLVHMRFSVAPTTNASVAWIELHGMVLRTEPQPGSAYGTAIRVTHHRLIYATAQSIAQGAARWPDPDVLGH